MPRSVAVLQRTSVPPRPAFPSRTDKPPPEVLRAWESDGTAFLVRHLPPWQCHRGLYLRRSGKMPVSPLPECARDSAARHCAACELAPVYVLCAWPKKLATGD